MRINTLKKRCCGAWLALLMGAIPIVCVAQEARSQTDSFLSAPPVLEATPPGPEGLPPLISPSFDDGTVFEARPSEVPGKSEPTRGERKGNEGIAIDDADSSTDDPIPAFPFGYNLRQGNLSWLVGRGDDFGDFSLESIPSLAAGEKMGLVGSTSFHFLSGPSRTDMPPRLFDFQIGWQQRNWTSDTFGYDLSARVGAFSDFEGSARKGIRFPGHAVGYYRWNATLDLVLGIEVLDRDDISLLPVVGVILKPRDDLLLELVFPRPRIEVLMTPTHSLYLAGELGGGTWAIERTTQNNDVVTYRDLRLLLGISSRDEKGNQSGLEIGYVFGRDLSYRSGVGDYQPGDTLLIRLTNRY